MDVGITLPTKADSWRVVKRAEELGFSHAWFYDTTVLNAEIFAAMGAAAVTTSRIRLCTGVLTPSNRLAPVAASGLATLNALAPGRIICGVGTGFTGRRTLGLPAITLENFERYILAVKGLLHGEIVETTIEGRRVKTKLMTPEPDMGIINISDPIPIHISALGPKGRRVTARIGDGWIGMASMPQAEVAAINDMRAAWSLHGRDPSQFYGTMVIGGCVLDDGESADSPRALAQAGPQAALLFHNFVEQEAYGSVLAEDQFPFRKELAAYRAIYNKYEPPDARHLSNHRGHLMFVRPEEKHITGDVIRALTMTGTRAELIERLRGVRDMGYAQVAFNLPPGQEEDLMQRWMDVIQAV